MRTICGLARRLRAGWLIAAVVAAAVYVALGAAEDEAPHATGTQEGSVLLWAADHEEGTLEDWSRAVPGDDSTPGLLANSGTYEALASSEFARSGTYSLKATIGPHDTETSGVRAFRLSESRRHQTLRYRAWFYIPRAYRQIADPSAGRFWNLVQFKSRSVEGRSDPVWALYVRSGPAGKRYLTAGWGWGGTELDGPWESSDFGPRWFEQRRAELPIGRWFQLEARLTQSSEFAGRLTVWQDGVELFDFDRVRTSYPYAPYDEPWGANNQWSVNNYSDGLAPEPAAIYIDDAEIRTEG